MPDREHEDLEKELRDLGPRIKYPPTPDVARTVRRRLETEPMQRRRGLRAFVTPGWAVAAAAIILLSLTVLSPAIRSTVPGSMSSGASGGAGQANGGGAGASDAGSAEYAAEPPTHSDGAAASGGTSHEVPEEASAASSAGASAGTSASPGLGFGLGERITASEARARMGRLLLPETPELSGDPGVIYARGPSEADGVALVFAPGPGLPPLGDTGAGLLLFEVPGDLESAYPSIQGASGPPPEEIDVGGHRGYWFPDGRLLRSSPPADDLPGGALLWQQEETALLMRANLTREEAIRIAGTIR